MLAVVQIHRVMQAYKEAIEISGEAMPSYMKENLRTLLQCVPSITLERPSESHQNVPKTHKAGSGSI